ncbi:tellurite resistance TerB family protein [Photobacterium sanguinicancri]|uniref:Tellurite resistance TerB family protein n=1 Tax=Photobacterium sanguinicancri TaxID=875932 RepID=A0AAW7YAH9_9GAMM|nr:tellurite resistance TerB family protein [Photobacterium sanguinicancri]MDO6545317.1 tellurite resistance TerB family protein [Photobacterium sanguinicancri]
MKSLMDQLLGQATKLMDSGKSAAVSSSSNKTDLLKGAVGGGLIGTLLGNKKSRKMVSKYGTKAAMVGGTAVAGTLAYQAYKKWQQDQPSESTAPQPLSTSSVNDKAIEVKAEASAENVLLLKAMVFAARSDGHVDEAEKQAITGWVHQQGVGENVETIISRWMNEPLDPAVLAKDVTNLEQASEVYLVSLLAIDVDHFMEKAYLAQLSHALGLPQGLVEKIEEQASL